MTHWNTLAGQLFPLGHAIREQDGMLSGSARVGAATVSVIGTCGHAAIGVELALALAQAVLETVRTAPGRAIVILVDTAGQRLRLRDEMLGIHSYLAHFSKSIDFARQQHHQVLALVYDLALSGGFVSSGLMADACYALPGATIRVMELPAMARITRVAEARLQELAKSNPVFAPGPENYWRMGGLQAIWQGGLAQRLEQALEAAPQPALAGSAGADTRAALGMERGGRQLALPVIAAIMGVTDVPKT